MTTTRRRSSAGSAAAAAPDPPAAATTPTSVRSSRRRASLLARRESDAMDLGLLGRASPGLTDTPRSNRSGGAGGGGAGSAIQFFDGEGEEGELVIGGWRFRPMRVVGTLFLLGLLVVLTLLTLYPGATEGLAKDLSFTGPRRAGLYGNATLQELALDSPMVLAAIEDAIEERFRQDEAERAEQRSEYKNLEELVQQVLNEGGGKGGGGGGGGGEGEGFVAEEDLKAVVAELESVKAQMQQYEEVKGQMEEALLRRPQGGEAVEDLMRTAATVADLQAKIEAWEAARAAGEEMQQPPEQQGDTAALEEKLGQLDATVQALGTQMADVEAGKAEVVQASEELRSLLEQQPALVEEARAIRAAVEGEVGALKEGLMAIAASAEGEKGGDLVGGVRAAVADAVAAAKAQVEMQAAVDQQLGRAQEVLVQLRAAMAAAEERVAGEGEDGGRLHELQEELAGVREEAAKLQRELKEQEARMATALEEVKTAMVASQQQGQEGQPALDQEAVQALVAAELDKHRDAFTAAAAAVFPPSTDPAAKAEEDDARVKAIVEEEMRQKMMETEMGWAGLDYAAAAGGATVLRDLSSPTYTPAGSILPSNWYERMGYYGNAPPKEVVISAGALGKKRLGDCWPMRGRSGQLTVQLPSPVVPTAVVLEHVPPKLSQVPTSAPRRFAVWGRTSVADTDPVKLHRADFLAYDAKNGTAVQVFEMDYSGPHVKVVTLDVIDNWGNEAYTCLYRFRVLAPPEKVLLEWTS